MSSTALPRGRSTETKILLLRRDVLPRAEGIVGLLGSGRVNKLFGTGVLVRS